MPQKWVLVNPIFAPGTTRIDQNGTPKTSSPTRLLPEYIFRKMDTVGSSRQRIPDQLTDYPVTGSEPITVTNQSEPAVKIRLFRSLFRGREDVYPRRFENRRTGKGGYAPACANEWVRGVCEKPIIKCADCPHRKFYQVTDEVTGWHLSGRDPLGRDFVMGSYPMLRDETCFFLAVDFDGADWQKDAQAFLQTCHRLDLPATLERSRS